MVGLSGSFAESLMLQLPHDGLHGGPGPLQSSMPLHSPLPKWYDMSCWWWLVWLLALFLCLDSSIFTSSPRAVIMPPHANAAVADLAWSHHRSVNPALSPSTDYCTRGNAGWRSLKWWQRLFFFSYWLLTDNKCAQYYHLAGQSVQWQHSNDNDNNLSSQPSGSNEGLEVIRAHYFKKWKIDIYG